MFFRFDKPDEAIVAMQKRGVNVVGLLDLYSRSGD